MIRQILINEPNLDLRYIYFDVLMIDGLTPALDETGGQPEINITSTGWSSVNIGLLETVGHGRYRALLDQEAVNQLGVIISRYIGANTFECFGESIEVIQNYRIINIFEDSDSPIISTYVDVNEAEKYFSFRLNSETWNDANVQDKIKSLVTATQDIENLAFSGWKTDSGQTLEFPRNNNLFIPKQIKQATCEIAIRYLEGYNDQLENDSIKITEEAFFNVKNNYDSSISEDAKRAGINNERAWRLLKPFLRDLRTIKITRVN